MDGTEPILSLKEYKKVENSSQEVILQVPSGKVVISGYDNEAINEDKTLAGFLVIPPGFYKVRVFVISLPDEEFSYHVVLAKVDKFTVNTLTDYDILP